jgi:hypothetical protein
MSFVQAFHEVNGLLNQTSNRREDVHCQATGRLCDNILLRTYCCWCLASTVSCRRYLVVTTALHGGLSGWFFTFPLNFIEIIGIRFDKRFRFVFHIFQLLREMLCLSLASDERASYRRIICRMCMFTRKEYTRLEQ